MRLFCFLLLTAGFAAFGALTGFWLACRTCTPPPAESAAPASIPERLDPEPLPPADLRAVLSV